tara:strand:+ start:151 stop:525 length:375 start_codon:yes stop_codon:yes gene_type:complete
MVTEKAKTSNTAHHAKIDANFTASPSKGGSRSNEVWTLLRTPTAIDQAQGSKSACPAQEQKIIETLLRNGDTLPLNGAKSLCGEGESNMGSILLKNGLITVQGANKICAYYRNHLVKFGYISIS